MSSAATLPDSCRQQLVKGLDSLQLSFSEQQLEQWLAYLALLNKWNGTYNLTSVRDPEEMVSRHLLDSLSIAPFLQGQRFIDVGTGPGLPGIPLAIYYPDKTFALLDSNGKRTRFLQQVKLQLKLANIEIFHGRVEKHQPDQLYQGVLSRAFASIEDMLEWTSHLCAHNGCFLAMKGLYPEQEIAQLPDGYQLDRVESIGVPGSDAERHLVIIAKTAE